MGQSKVQPRGNDQARIDQMYRFDSAVAWGFIAGLVASIAAVLFSLKGLISDGGIWLGLLISGALVLLFNIAAVAAMLRHYAEDKLAIYIPDIRHLDERRAGQLSTRKQK